MGASGRAGAGGRTGGRRAGARSAGGQATVRAARRWRARGKASGRAAGRTVRAGHGRQAAWARSLCAQAGPAGPGWGFVHSDSVFFGPVRLGSFLSHQMNTVHCKIKKKKIFLRKKKKIY